MKLVIYGRLPGMNEIISEDRRNRHAGAKLKKEYQYLVELSARKSLKRWRPEGPVWMTYRWYEKDRRRDKSNVCAGGRKIIEDALVRTGYLHNDGWNDIKGFTDEFYVDKNEPRIEVEIEEVEL